MAVDHEPRLVPPQAPVLRSIFDISGFTKTKGASPVHDGSFRTEVGRQEGCRNPYARADKSHGGSSRHSRLKVASWEDSLPRLGFGALDFGSLLDYEKRPKTPDESFLKAPTSPTRLSTPPHTPSDKPLGLSAGIAEALSEPVFAASPSSVTYSATVSVALNSSGGRDQSTLQSSPPAPNPTPAAKYNEVNKIQHREQSSPCNEGLDITNEFSDINDDEVPVKNSSEEEVPQSAEYAWLTDHGAEVYPRLLNDNQVPLPTGSRVTQESIGKASNTLWQSAESPVRLGYTRNNSPIKIKDYASTPRGSPFNDKVRRQSPVAPHKIGTPTSNLDSDRYLEIIRAAAQLTPQSRQAINRDVSVGVNGDKTDLRTVSPSKANPGNASASHIYPQKPKHQPRKARLSLGAYSSEPVTPKALSKTRHNEPGSILKSTYTILSRKDTLIEKKHVEVARFRHKSPGLPSNTPSKTLQATDIGDDDDDDDTGGCSVESAIDLQQGQIVFGREAPRFSRKKPTQAHQLIQDAFKAQVREAASFSAQFLTVTRLTKDDKFDNLIRKLQAKKLLHAVGDPFNDKDVSVFVDMSNIFIGFQDAAKTSQGLPISARVTWSPFCFEHLAFALERGRKIVKRKLAGSVRQAHQMNNLPTHVVEAQNYGYETKILHQVVKLDPNRPSQSSPYTSADEGTSGTLCPRTKLGEQGVDETLHLSMQDSILDAQGNPGVMVLATGDAKPAEYSDGFAHYAIKALKHGWHVEVVSWKKCLSGEWKKSPFKDKYAKQFRIIILDDLFEELRADWVGGSPAVLARV